MKKSVALTLLSITSLYAEQCCCVPEPKKCIDCECYTPAYTNLQCDSGFFASVDFLYWFAKETNLDYAVQVVTERTVAPLPLGTDILVPVKTNYLDTKWDPGFRIGLGWNMDCDGWDLNLMWSYYHNKKSNTTTVPSDYSNQGDIRFPNVNQAALLNPWLDANINSGALFTFDSISARWMLNLNEIDLELGRKFWLSRCFALRPFTGIRGAWLKTTFSTSSERNAVLLATPLQGPFFFTDRYTSKVWGVGILGGIQPEWHFSHRFILFSNLEASLIWGEFKSTKHEFYDTTVAQLGNNWKNDFFTMQSIVDLSIGLRWEETWGCDRYKTALDLGWEQHIWFDFNQRNKTINSFLSTTVSAVDAPPVSGFSNITEITSNLMLGGLVVRARFDF